MNKYVAESPKKSEIQTCARRKTLDLWFWTAVIVSAVLILAFPINWYFPDFMPRTVGAMLLSKENNVGAWWSGVLLFALANLAYSAGAVVRSSAPRVGRAWIIIAAILVFLSADEIGSIHERLGIYGGLWGVGEWGLVLPLGGLLGTFLILALYTMWRQDESSREYIFFLVVGFALLGSVAVQEYIGDVVNWGTGAVVWVRAAIEEGTELLGMIIILRATLLPSMRPSAINGEPKQCLFMALSDYAPRIFLALFALAPIFVFLVVRVGDHRGRLTSWLVITSFISAGMLVLSKITNGDTKMYRRFAAIILLSLAASLVPMSVSHTATLTVAASSISAQIFLIAFICGVMSVVWLTVLQPIPQLFKALMVVYTIIAAVGLLAGSGQMNVLLVTQVLAILYLLITYIALRKPEIP